MSEEKDDDIISEEVLYEKLITIYSRLERSLVWLCVFRVRWLFNGTWMLYKELEPDLWLNAIWGADEDQPVWENTGTRRRIFKPCFDHVHGNHEQFVVLATFTLFI